MRFELSKRLFFCDGNHCHPFSHSKDCQDLCRKLYNPKEKLLVREQDFFMTQGRLQMQLAPYEMILLSTFTTSILKSYHHKKK